MCTPRNSNHLRSHLRAIMALDHGRLRLEKNSRRTNKAEFFAFDKFSSRMMMKFISFLHCTSTTENSLTRKNLISVFKKLGYGTQYQLPPIQLHRKFATVDKLTQLVSSQVSLKDRKCYLIYRASKNLFSQNLNDRFF